MFQNFFAQDNATAKLSSWLILAASVLSTISHGLHLSPMITGILFLLSGIFTIVAQFFQSNKVISRSSWFLLIYMIVDFVAHNQVIFPNANDLLLTLASVLTLFVNFSKQSATSSEPPSSKPLQ